METTTAQYVSVPEAARMLGISERSISRLLDSRKLRYITPLKHRRVEVRSILEHRAKVSGNGTPNPLPAYEDILSE